MRLPCMPSTEEQRECQLSELSATPSVSTPQMYIPRAFAFGVCILPCLSVLSTCQLRSRSSGSDHIVSSSPCAFALNAFIMHIARCVDTMASHDSSCYICSDTFLNKSAGFRWPLPSTHAWTLSCSNVQNQLQGHQQAFVCAAHAFIGQSLRVRGLVCRDHH